MHDIECPYCGKEQEINHDDGYGYCEDEVYQQHCSDCDRYFVYTTSVSYSYEANKADCLNDGKHDWKPSHSYPKCATKMVCSMCDERREPTEVERVENKIPTYKEEFPDEFPARNDKAGDNSK